VLEVGPESLVDCAPALLPPTGAVFSSRLCGLCGRGSLTTVPMPSGQGRTRDTDCARPGTWTIGVEQHPDGSTEYRHPVSSSDTHPHSWMFWGSGPLFPLVLR
jgi:hypothetical protein